MASEEWRDEPEAERRTDGAFGLKDVTPTRVCDGSCAQAHGGKGVAAIRACAEARGGLRKTGEKGWRGERIGEKQILSDKVGIFGPEPLGIFERYAQDNNRWSGTNGGPEGGRVAGARRRLLAPPRRKKAHYSTFLSIVK